MSKKNLALIGAIIIVMMILLASVAFLLVQNFNLSKSLKLAQNVSSTASSSETSLQSSVSSSNNSSASEAIKYEYKNKIFFNRSIPSDYGGKNELWLVDVSTGKSENLNIVGYTGVRTYINSKYAILTKYEVFDKYFVFNKETRQIESEITFPEVENADPRISTSTTLSVSPNGKYAVYQLEYASAVRPDENDDGPTPIIDPYPISNSGYYSYNFETKKSKFLGSFFLITNYSEDGNSVYITGGEDYHEAKLKGGFYKINLETAEKKLMDEDKSSTAPATLHVSDINYIESKNIKIKNYQGYNSNPQQKLEVEKNGKATTIQSGSWASFQPFISISPDSKYFFYQRANGYSSGREIDDLVLVDLTNNSSKTLYKGTSSSNPSMVYINWVNNKEVVILVRKSLENNRINDLLKIDVTTGKVTELTKNFNTTLD